MISPNEKFQKTISSSINERGGLKKPQKVLPKMVSSPEIDQMKILKKSNIELLDQTKIEEVFASHFILRSVDHNRRLSLIQQLILCEVEEKKIIFEENSIGKYFYIIKSGKVKLEIGEIMAKTMGEWECFGDLALIHNATRSGTIKTLMKTQLWCLDNNTFRTIINEINNKNFFEKEKFFDSIQILSLLDKNIKSKLCLYLILEKYDKDKFIINEGDEPTAIYFIKEGSVSVIKNSEEVRALSSGEFFGDKAILTQSKRSLSVKTKTDVTVYSLSTSAMKEVMSSTFREFIFVNYIKYAFDSSGVNIDIATIWKLFPCFKLRNYKQNEVVFRKGYQKTNSIVIIIEGNIKNKHSRKYIPIQKGEILFKEVIFGGTSGGNNFVSNDLVAEPDCLLLMSGVSEINVITKMSLKEYIRKCRVISSLCKIPLFKNLRITKIEQILQNISIESFKRNDIIIKEGEEGDNFYIIQSGKVDIYIKNKYMRTLNDFEFFGEKSLVINEKRSATAIVKSESAVLYSINKKNFQKIIFEDNLLKFLNHHIMLQDNDLQLSDLDFLRKLGSGTFGDVFLVQKKVTLSSDKNRSNNYVYALKKVSLINVLNAQIAQYIESEKKILLQIEHPFIVKLVKTLKDNKNIYFLMENVEGFELFDIIRTIGLLNKEQCTFYTAQLLLIAHYFQKRNIIHRDIKPENVIVLPNGYIKLIDFGTAKIIKENNTTLTVIGTPTYMSPEVIKGENYSFDADIWSIAVCLYEFGCGKVPFGNDVDDPLLIYKSIILDDLKFPEFICDSQYKSLCKRLLNKSKVKRLTNISSIKEHDYFLDFDWDSLIDLNFKVPFVPGGKDASFREPKGRDLLEVLEEIEEKQNKTDLQHLEFDNEENKKKFKEWYDNF